MKKFLLMTLVILLSGCASTIKMVESGDRAVGERMFINIQGNWNHFDLPALKPAEVWTMEGLSIDELTLYAGIKDGEALNAKGNPDQKKRTLFRGAMQTEEIITLFENKLTQDGSTFKLVKLEPYPFGGKKGFRFEYERIRRLDHVQQRGVGFGAIDNGELFALIYHAPRLTFFPRHQQRVEDIAKSVSIH
jgi:hypothetical protein